MQDSFTITIIDWLIDLCICMDVGTVLWCPAEDSFQALILSFMYAPGIELRRSSLAASTLTCWPTEPYDPSYTDIFPF